MSFRATGAVEVELEGAVDHAHAAVARHALDPMAGEDVARLEIGGGTYPVLPHAARRAQPGRRACTAARGAARALARAPDARPSRADLYCPPRAPVEPSVPGRRLGGRRRRRGGPAGPPPGAPRAPGGHRRLRRRAVRAVRRASRARARATWRPARCRCGRYIAHYEMPNDDPEALERARARRLPGPDRPRARARRAAGRCGCSARSARPGGAAARRAGARLGALAVVPHPARDGAPTCWPATATASRPAALRMYAVFDLGVIGYWALPTAPPWYAAQQGRSATPTLRRMMVEHGEAFWEDRWDAALQSPGRQPARRHALAALRHIRDGRAPARARRARWRARSAGPTRSRSASRSSTSASTTSIDLLAGLALTEAVRRQARRGVAPAAARAGPRRRSASRHGRTRERRPRTRRRRRTPSAEGERRRRGDAARPDHAAQRRWSRCCSSPSVLAFLYFVLPRARRHRGHVEPHRRGRPVVARARARRSSPVVRRLRRCSSRASTCAPGSPIDLPRELPDHDGRPGGDARLRRRRRGRHRADGVGAAPRRDAAPRGRRADDRLPRPDSTASTWSAMLVGGLGLRVGIFPGPAPFGAHRRPGDLRRASRSRLPGRSRSSPTDLERRLGRVRRRGGRGSRAGASGWPTVPGVDVGRRPLRDRQGRAAPRPGDARLGRLLGVQHRGAVGVVPRVRRRRRRAPCSSWASSSACSATCCRCRAASAASTAA